MNLKKIWLFFLLLLFTATSSQQTTTGSISVKLEGLKNNKGQIRACLFNNESGFPDKPIKSYQILKSQIVDSINTTISFSNLPFGEYAIAILHDEDNDDIMKTGTFGMPKEGYGISNNAKGIFGPPKFDEAKIKLSLQYISIKVKMRYP